MTSDPSERPRASAAPVEDDVLAGPAKPEVVAEPPEPEVGAEPADSEGAEIAVAVADDRPPRAHRATEGALLAGVCQGVAEHLGWPVVLVRAGMVGLAAMQLLGVAVYGVLWVLMPHQGAPSEAPGLQSAQRRGLRRRTGGGTPSTRDATALVALGLFGVGATTLAVHFGVGPSAAFFWPVAFAVAGVALVWRQADLAIGERNQDQTATGEVEPHRPRWRSRRVWQATVRVGVGMGLVGVSVSMVAASRIGVAQLPLLLGLSVLMVLGIGISAAPWLARLLQASRQARERQVVEDARADMAAHLHDSVLQTLALIQRQPDDPRVVAALARRQERELRAWLYGAEPDSTTLKAALTTAAAEIEDATGTAVEVVFVGDATLTAELAATVRAAREAMMNAAKHSGADRVDVFGEVEDGRAEVFVRDRGVGFDLALVADDRMGLSRSIIGRMERHGGTARVRSAPGEGTEVRLQMTTEGER